MAQPYDSKTLPEAFPLQIHMQTYSLAQRKQPTWPKVLSHVSSSVANMRVLICMSHTLLHTHTHKLAK